MIDWDLVVKIAVPVGTLILGKYLDRWLARRSRLVTFLGHVSDFVVGPQKTPVYTHAIVLRNAGRATASNVRVGHNVLPDYRLAPSVAHSVVQTPQGTSEIVFPQLVPGEQVTISYLYFPPLTWDKINSYTKSDDGFAKVLNVIPQPQPSKLVLSALWLLIATGSVTLIYLLIQWVRGVWN